MFAGFGLAIAPVAASWRAMMGSGASYAVAILPGSQVLRFMIPRYVQDDPALARVLDEAAADRICDALTDRSVADLLPVQRTPLPVVGPDDTALEIAAIMAANRCPWPRSWNPARNTPR